MSGNHKNCSIVEIGQNTKKSLGDLRTLAVTQTPVENHQLTLVDGSSCANTITICNSNDATQPRT